MSNADISVEKDSLGDVPVPASKLWGAQTQRSLEHFSIGTDLIPREMIAAYAILKKSAANANHDGGRLDDERHALIVRVCDENSRRPASGHVPAACLDDGQRHAIQYEHQRGDLKPLLSAGGHAARE
jgi:fumarate hydratase class II